MSVLTKNKIDKLNGIPIRLTSDETQNKLLSIDPHKKVYLEKDNEAYDQRWSFVSSTDKAKFLIISSKDKNLVCHDPKDGGNITIIPLSNKINTDICEWQISKKGEIYRDIPTEQGEKYLWLADDGLFVTSDGFLAELWKINDSKEIKTVFHSKENAFLKLLFCGMLIIVIFLFLKKA